MYGSPRGLYSFFALGYIWGLHLRTKGLVCQSKVASLIFDLIQVEEEEENEEKKKYIWSRAYICRRGMKWWIDQMETWRTFKGYLVHTWTERYSKDFCFHYTLLKIRILAITSDIIAGSVLFFIGNNKTRFPIECKKAEGKFLENLWIMSFWCNNRYSDDNYWSHNLIWPIFNRKQWEKTFRGMTLVANPNHI